MKVFLLGVALEGSKLRNTSRYRSFSLEMKQVPDFKSKCHAVVLTW